MFQLWYESWNTHFFYYFPHSKWSFRFTSQKREEKKTEKSQTYWVRSMFFYLARWFVHKQFIFFVNFSVERKDYPIYLSPSLCLFEMLKTWWKTKKMWIGRIIVEKLCMWWYPVSQKKLFLVWQHHTLCVLIKYFCAEESRKKEKCTIYAYLWNGVQD